ncbi:MAG: T9SS type A sorting domain-containing protein [Candidatus Marinimicrobia bacterium]|nr:T9SS type A sorting domain-containing protein [Candidatus Neomarinimicrobiota bacterium]MCF7840355.1 T9SS type A sorting domain-containing protein [Candidatus Neomarinimicrobiota bacterium]MCF7902968.1 T9SS type A sorting domain-containing protein [Candidatus Neomarinimicrobiota bacterium]
MIKQFKWIIFILPLYLLGMGGDHQLDWDWNDDGYPERITWDNHQVVLSINRMGLLQPGGVLRKNADGMIEAVRFSQNASGLTILFSDGTRESIDKNEPLLATNTPSQLPVYDPPPNTVDFDLTIVSPPNFYRSYVCGAADLDEDGADELLTATYDPLSPFSYATLQVWKTTGDNELTLFDTVPGVARYSTESVVQNVDILNNGDRWTISSHHSMGGSPRMALKINDNNNVISHSLNTGGIWVYSSDFTDLAQDNQIDWMYNDIADDGWYSNYFRISEFDHQQPNGSISYSMDTSIGVPTGVSYIRAGDIDADGSQEIVLGSRNFLFWSDTSYIYYYDSAGGTLDFNLERIPVPYAYNPAYIGICDSDQNGVDEIVALGPLILSPDPWQVVYAIMTIQQVNGQFQVMDVDTTSFPYPAGGAHQVVLREYNGTTYLLIPTDWGDDNPGHLQAALYLFKIENGQIVHMWHSPTIDSATTWSGDLGDFDGDGLLEAAIVYGRGIYTHGAWQIYESPDIQTGTVPEPEPIEPDGISVGNPYPNPFNPSVTIPFGIPENGTVTFEIYDILGRLVYSISSQFTPGTHNFVWQGVDSQGNKVASGVYIARVVSGTESKLVRLAFTK